MSNNRRLSPRLNFFFLLLFSLFLTSCEFAPTYQRQDLEKLITSLCKEEFDVDVKVWDKGETLWVFAPFGKITDDGQDLLEPVKDDLRRIRLSIFRSLMNIEDPPERFVFIISDTQAIGLDWYTVSFVPDMVKLFFNYISIGDSTKRSVNFYFQNNQAFGDISGSHIVPYDLAFDEFMTTLIHQNLARDFLAPNLGEVYEVNDLTVKSGNGALQVAIDVRDKELSKKHALPLKVAQDSVRRLLDVYRSFHSFRRVEIRDNFSKKTSSFSLSKPERENRLGQETTLGLTELYLSLS